MAPLGGANDTCSSTEEREKTSSIELNFDEFIREVSVVHIAKNPIEMGGPAGQVSMPCHVNGNH